MRLGTSGFCGARLQEAREAREMTVTGLSEFLGLTPGSVSNYEHDRSTPAPEVMDKIETKLGLPRRFFLRPVTEADAVEDMLFYRSLSSATKQARQKAKRRFRWLQEIVSYLRVYLDFPAINLPDIKLPEDVRKLTGDQIAEIGRAHV